jgi:hypothetical protein
MTGTRTLGTYELAYLAGGPRRAAEVATVALVETGVLRVNRTTGELILLQRRPCHELEAAVLEVVESREPRLLGTVCWQLRADVRLTGIGERLKDEGLLVRSVAPESLPRRWWSVVCLTGTGRRSLRQRRRNLDSDATDALRVALSGPAAMSDRGLYVALFDPLPPVPARQLRRATPAALADAGYHPGEATFLAGGALGGGGGFDGGGGGGDGG